MLNGTRIILPDIIQLLSDSKEFKMDLNKIEIDWPEIVLGSLFGIWFIWSLLQPAIPPGMIP